MKQRIPGEKYRPVVTVVKLNKTIPSVIHVGGYRYIRDDASRVNIKKKK